MPEPASASLSAELRDDFPVDSLLLGLLDMSLTGMALYVPVRGAGGGIVDFSISLLSEAAQRLLGLPKYPGQKHLQLFPESALPGVFDFCRSVFESGDTGQHTFTHRPGGFVQGTGIAARRVGAGLLVSYSNGPGEPVPAPEAEPRETPAPAAADPARGGEEKHHWLHSFLMEAPVAICLHGGPEHTYEVVNPAYQEIVGKRTLVGRTIREAMPELTGQNVFELLDHVYQTGESVQENEVPVVFHYGGNFNQKPGRRYYNLTYQARRNAHGRIDGVITLAVNVTDLVEARHRLEISEEQATTSNEELAAANEELQAANEEIRASNDDLVHAQFTLRELNLELEARVADRTLRLQSAQAEAERQKARLERFFMQAPAAICVLDGPDLRYELVNPAYQALFPGRQLEGLAILDALPEIANHAVYATFRQVYETGITHEEHSLLIPIARPGETELEDRYFNFIQQARYDENGVVDGILVFAFEVTEQIRAHRRSEALQAEALASAEQLVRQRETLYQVFEQTPAGVAILRGPEHLFEYVNPGYQALFPGRALLGQPLAEALPETVEFGFLELLNQVYATSESFFGTELPLQVRDAAGNLLPEAYFTFTYQAYEEAGATVGVSIFAFDVTEQVLARQRAAALQEEVRHRDAQLQALFEQAPVAIAVLRGARFVVELANPAMCGLWGRTHEELLGKALFDVMPELSGQGFDLLLESVILTGVAYTAQETAVHLQRHGQTETLYTNFVYQPLRDGEGRITGVAVVATDVSEQVAARQRLAQANEELTGANGAVSVRNTELATANQQLLRTNQDLDNFVYAASHDLKQPVNNLAGLFEELRASTVFNDPEEETLLVPMVDDALRQLASTINDLATVGQVQQLSGLPSETVDLKELTTEVLQTLQPQVLAARARITMDFSARPTITYARANLRTILLNLLSNSLKYADPARPCRVHLSLWVQEGRPMLLVEDNGLGFDVQRHRGELFHLFRRFHDHTEGTGVGLYLVNRIVQSHGGRVEVESEVGEGTTFRVFL